MNSSTRTSRSRTEQGYILLSLLLVMALLVIGAAIAASTISFEIRRDREEEMIHRAMQYRSAIRQFTKHSGRFPRTIDELVNINGQRYLRKVYKDPITGKDFRILRLGDIPNPLQPGASATGLTNSQDANSESSAGQSQMGTGAQAGQSSTSGPSPSPGSPTGLSSAQPGGVVIGGLIAGVASTSSKETIREFDRKNRYNRWLFYYDPTNDPGREVWGPTSLTRIPVNPGIPGNVSMPGNASGQPTTSSPTPQSPTTPQQ